MIPFGAAYTYMECPPPLAPPLSSSILASPFFPHPRVHVRAQVKRAFIRITLNWKAMNVTRCEKCERFTTAVVLTSGVILSHGRRIQKVSGLPMPLIQTSEALQVGKPVTAGWKLSRPHRPGQTVLPTQANSSRVHNFEGVGYCLATRLAWVSSSWLEFDQAQIFAQLEARFPLHPTLTKLFCYCYVITR